MNQSYNDYFAQFAQRNQQIEEKIANVYRHKNTTIPKTVYNMNYWMDGENPELIPTDYFDNPAVMTQFQLDRMKQHMENFEDDFIPSLFPWYGTGVIPSAMGCEIIFHPNQNLFIWMCMYPEEVHQLMDFCADVLIEWITIQKKHAGQELNSGAWPHGIILPKGFGGVWIADDDYTQISAEHYSEFVVPYNSKYYTQMFHVLKQKSTILSSYISYGYALDNGRYAITWTRRSKNHPTPGIIEPLLPDISI